MTAQPALEAAPAGHAKRTVDGLYSRPVPSKRTGAIYNAFSYPTKIDAEAIALFIAVHTKPGDTVLDVFGGSGSAGIAARLCDQPTHRMRQMAADAAVEVDWGPRKAVISELSPLGALLADVMCNPPDPETFRKAAAELLDAAADSAGWMYDALDPDGQIGSIRYVIWSEVLTTPCCNAELTLWEGTVTLNPLIMGKTLPCPACGQHQAVSVCGRVTVEKTDELTGEPTTQRKRLPARVCGQTGKKTWSRQPTADDLERLASVEAEPLTVQVPTEKIAWGDLYRSGYHTGIERFHHLYTPRNLRVLGELWSGISKQPAALQAALRLLVLSYNATHSSLLTRVVVKTGQKDFVVTGAQSGVLYISGLPVEKNVLSGVRRKIDTFAQAFALTINSTSSVRVINGSSTKLDLEDDTIDYVFTDPPFGDFIPYAEVNQVNEVWLGKLTDRASEAIISPAQGKTVDDYARLMSGVFAEVARVVKPSGAVTVVFHASKPAVWQALGDAFRDHGLTVERTSVLDKTQVSFKQVVHEGGTRGDAVFLLRPAREDADNQPAAVPVNMTVIVESLRAEANGNADELTPRRLYSRYVGKCVENGLPVEHTAPEFYALVTQAAGDEGAA